MSDFGSHPLFHDVVGVIGHLLYYDQGVWVKRCHDFNLPSSHKPPAARERKLP